jgi:Ca2+:H+ antiporter
VGLSWLLLFVPVAVGLEAIAPEAHRAIFLAAALAIVPLAGWMGRATEQLAERTGEGIGGLLNATFGNAAAIGVVLLACYALFLVFSLLTHRHLFMGAFQSAEHGEPAWSLGRAALVLGAATALIAWMSEILVGALEPAGAELGLNDTFMGVFVVALLGNAAEHFTAIGVARKDRMDLSLSIAIGSSVQVALFLAPVLVLASLWLGPAPLDLAFTPGLVITVLLAVLVTGQVAGDGESNWLKGVQLLAVYAVLALAFFFLPASSPRP